MVTSGRALEQSETSASSFSNASVSAMPSGSTSPPASAKLSPTAAPLISLRCSGGDTGSAKGGRTEEDSRGPGAAYHEEKRSLGGATAAGARVGIGGDEELKGLSAVEWKILGGGEGVRGMGGPTGSSSFDDSSSGASCGNTHSACGMDCGMGCRMGCEIGWGGGTEGTKAGRGGLCGMGSTGLATS
jgi:hypothetical protein